uniref:Uncharacterized protein n=1 Tax=Anguilla anguilla TaxID=7936 RepID=A0A0E9QA44_ANGAN
MLQVNLNWFVKHVNTTQSSRLAKQTQT